MSLVGRSRTVERGQLTGSRPPQQGYGQPPYNGYQSTPPPPQQYGYQQVSFPTCVRGLGGHELTWNSRLSRATASTASRSRSKAHPRTSSAPA